LATEPLYAGFQMQAWPHRFKLEIHGAIRAIFVLANSLDDYYIKYTIR
jgi:hypothetical protein